MDLLVGFGPRLERANRPKSRILMIFWVIARSGLNPDFSGFFYNFKDN
jgi:hypothetical protein